MIAMVLREIDLFRPLDHQSLDLIWDAGLEIEFCRGERIIAESEPGDEIYAIRSGRVDIEITLPHRGQVEVIATLKPGEIFGEMSLGGRERRIASARARDDVQLVQWSAPKLLEILEKDPATGFSFLKKMTTLLSRRLAATTLALRNELDKTSYST